jgi:hypothetical protein
VLEGLLFCKPHMVAQFRLRGKYETSAAFKRQNDSSTKLAELANANATNETDNKKVDDPSSQS